MNEWVSAGGSTLVQLQPTDASSSKGKNRASYRSGFCSRPAMPIESDRRRCCRRKSCSIYTARPRCRASPQWTCAHWAAGRASPINELKVTGRGDLARFGGKLSSRHAAQRAHGRLQPAAACAWPFRKLSTLRPSVRGSRQWEVEKRV